jgi:hypothetical protein
MTRADWGVGDADGHRGWFIAEVDSREEAMQLLPPDFRKEATVIEIKRLSREEITTIISELEQ